MRPISFCIPTAKNEKDYVLLLLKSLIDNTQISLHEIIIFVDTDNQGSYEELVQFKIDKPYIRVCKNPDPHMIGAQINMTVMFNEAKNDIVCYLQSDMVVGKDLDKHISNNIDENTVLSCTRIEPPLHPQSPEKIVENFGVNPEEFRYDDFNKYVAKIQSENRADTQFYFAPFAIFKKTWFDVLGGFDTQFRCSREDSDIQLRMQIAGLKIVQNWQACVYHFTCVSSRGKNWFKPDKAGKIQNILQQNADNEEIKKFIRKWGYYGPISKSSYDIGLYIEIDQFVDFQFLEWIEIYFKTLYLNEKYLCDELTHRIKFNSKYYCNMRWNYPDEYWESKRYLFNQDSLDNHIQYVKDPDKITNDIVIKCKYSDIITDFDQNRKNFIENINSIIEINDIGHYNVDMFQLDIKQKNDLSKSYIKTNNTKILLSDKTLIFK
jgi:GT2 family glycosyltransferase